MSRHEGLDPATLFAPLDDFRRLGLAVSGGADSLALMLLAARYAGDGGRDRFVVYSVDHGLRPEAADEAAFVAREAQRLGFAARVLAWNDTKPETGIQQAARLARYRLIAAAMREDGVPVLLTAHHLGDQAETVLMRLAHGSGLEGLRGMDYFAELDDLTIVRPLLGVEPDLLHAIVRQAGLIPVTDPSNADADYERVRWRQVLPQLAALGLTPERLSRFALRMRDADRALEAMATAAFAKAAVSPAQRSVVLGRDDLRRLPHAVAVRVVARALELAGDGAKPHALAAVEALTDRIISETFKTTLHGSIVESDGTSIRIAPEAGRAGARQRQQPQRLP